MKVIFLDIDEVLTSPGHTKACNSLVNFNINLEDRLSTTSLGLLKRLCDVTDAKIVISSAWRITCKIEHIKNVFANHGWDSAPIIDCTGSISDGCRGGEIQLWLDANPSVSDWIIIDDSSDMLEHQLTRLVHVNGAFGFTLYHYALALKLFGQPDKNVEEIVNFNWINRGATLYMGNLIKVNFGSKPTELAKPKPRDITVMCGSAFNCVINAVLPELILKAKFTVTELIKLNKRKR